MNSKRLRSQNENSSLGGDTLSPKKKLKTTQQNNYFRKTLEESGLLIYNPPIKCKIQQETINVIRNIKKNLQKHFEYPRNVADLFTNIENECKDINIFKHYVFPNVTKITEDEYEERIVNDSVFKILLSVPILQNRLTDYIFEKAIDLAANSKCGPWIQVILKCFSSLDSIISAEKLSTHLINLLDITTEKMVRLEIITAIPDIVGDQEHNNIAAEMSRILSEDHDLIPAILDCLSYLCLSDEQYEQLHMKTLNILMTLPKCVYFSNFIKFLLMPGKISETTYFHTVQGIRNALAWPTSIATQQEIATSQVLTATAIRSSMLSSRAISVAWLKVIATCKVDIDHKPIDFIILLILYSTTDEKQRQVENLIKKQVKLNILKENLLDEAFEKFKPIIKHNLKYLINITNCLLKMKSDSAIERFASKIFMLMFSHLDDCCQTIVAELLQLGLDCHPALMNILMILNEVATKDLSLLKPQSVQMLTLLDRMDNMSLNEIRAVMNLLCNLAYSFENSVIRDDIHMIIRKELGNSTPKIKIQGILAGLHAVKFLMLKQIENEQTVDFPDDVSYNSVTFLAEGDLREAAQIIELISRSSRQFPELIAFFYDELSNIINSANNINKNFLSWLTDAVTNDLQQNFIVDCIENERFGDLSLSMQYCLNSDSEMDEAIAINIAGLTLQPKMVVNIGILSPLFQLVQRLHHKYHDGTLSTIDALLGCPVIMPKIDLDLIEDMDNITVTNLLDCLVHCVNWFRELLNGFATQDDEALKEKILQRLLQVEQLENIVTQVLIKSNICYKSPMCISNINKYMSDHVQKKPKVANTKGKALKKPVNNDTLPETARSQPTQNNLSLKNKLTLVSAIPFRQLSLNLLHLFHNNIGTDDNHNSLNIKSFNFLLNCVNERLKYTLKVNVKRNHLAKVEFDYDPKKAEEYAISVNEVLPKLKEHLSYITSHIDRNSVYIESDELIASELTEYVSSLEGIYAMYTIYFKWIGFQDKNKSLLKTSLRKIIHNTSTTIVSLNDLITAAIKYMKEHEKYCLFLSTAISLVELIKTFQDFTDSKITNKTLKEMAKNFLSKHWKTPEGANEKGIVFNQSVDKLAEIYFADSEIVTLNEFTLQLLSEIKFLKNQKDTIASFKCISKGNFPILYRNLGSALYETTKSHLNKGLTNSEHLNLWKNVANILKNLSDMAKTLESRNNLAAFIKKSVPVVKLFLSQGIPILELQLKIETGEVLEILKILQQSTRFLQSLCCHSRLKKDKVLMSKVPFIRQLLETLIYKVKAALAANNCSEAFWMGNLKNKDIHGEIIATQVSIESEEVDDCDEELPEDNDSDSSIDDLINPDSKSLSDIV